MIYDCFLYAGERSLLKIRCEELSMLKAIGIKVKHIAVESKYTFTGHERKFSMTMADIQNYQIEWVPLNEVPYSDPWLNEQRQRNAIKSALVNLGAKDDDTVIISDVDEIPRTYAIQHYRTAFGLCALQMDVHCFYLNTLAERNSWRHAKIMPWSYLKDKTADEVRNGGFNLCLMNAGWHMTYMGGPNTVISKMNSFSHQESETQKFKDYELLESMMESNTSLWGKKMDIVPLSELPFHVMNNESDFLHLLKR